MNYKREITDELFDRYTQDDHVMNKARFWQAVNKLRIESSQLEPQVIKKNADGLLPCPFCKRTNMEIVRWSKNLFSISCKCGCESSNDSKSKEGIKRIWNRRR